MLQEECIPPSPSNDRQSSPDQQKKPSPGQNRGSWPCWHRSVRERQGCRTLAFGSASATTALCFDCNLEKNSPSPQIYPSRAATFTWIGTPPESVGHRTLARGLSDLAAMGAKPVAAFLSLGVPANLTRPGSASIGKESKSWVERFYDGFLALAKLHNVPLAGGDLAESPLVLADIVLTGAVPKNKALLRAGARPGDKIYVTGSLGGSAAQFSALSKSPKHFANQVSAEANQLSPHLYPQPRIAQGLWLRKHRLASAAMDLSDGLSTDLAHLCQESGVCAEIDAGAIPLGAGATLQLALDGGEDYELLFTAPRSAKLPRSIAGVPITSIGRIQKKAKARPQLLLVTGNARTPIEPRGWQHFSQTK